MHYLVSARTTDISAGATATGSLVCGRSAFGDFVASNNTNFPAASGLSELPGERGEAMGNSDYAGRTLEYYWISHLNIGGMADCLSE